jgi:hypothetical protein
MVLAAQQFMRGRARKMRVTLLLVLFATASATSGLAKIPGRGPEVKAPSANGLRISISSSQRIYKYGSQPQFRVELRNVGDHDLILNIGTMLANGGRQYPDAIGVILNPPTGGEQRLQLIGPTLVAGRVDPVVIPLPVGARYSVVVNLGKFAPFGDDPLKLEPGVYAIRARFQGNPAVDSNPDMKGSALMPYWQGTIVSPKLQFEVAKPQR